MDVRMIRIAAIISIALLLSGCGTIAARTSNANEGLYPATSIDGLCIVTGGGNWDNDHPSLSSKLVGWIILTPCWIIDLPVSLVSDTFMLPFDIRKSKAKDEEQAKGPK